MLTIDEILEIPLLNRDSARPDLNQENRSRPSVHARHQEPPRLNIFPYQVFDVIGKGAIFLSRRLHGKNLETGIESEPR